MASLFIDVILVFLDPVDGVLLDLPTINDVREIDNVTNSSNSKSGGNCIHMKLEILKKQLTDSLNGSHMIVSLAHRHEHEAEGGVNVAHVPAFHR